MIIPGYSRELGLISNINFFSKSALFVAFSIVLSIELTDLII